MNITRDEVRGLVIVVAILYGCYVAVVALEELARQAQRAQVATLRADLAAWQVSQLMEEARDITRAAAERGIAP
jgi:hypothetical protein